MGGNRSTLTVTSYGTSMKSSPPREGPHTKPISFCAVPYSKSASIGIGNKAKANISSAIPRNMNTFHLDFFSASCNDARVSKFSSSTSSTVGVSTILPSSVASSATASSPSDINCGRISSTSKALLSYNK